MNFASRKGAEAQRVRILQEKNAQLSLRMERSGMKQSPSLALRTKPCDCFVVPPRNDCN
jgi:hypothetical protein